MEKLTNLMNSFKIFLREIFRLSIAISLISGLFYLRFLTRVARDLYQNMSSIRILIICFILACVIFNIYTTLKSMGLIETKEPTGIKKHLKDLLEKFINYIYFTLKNLYEFIWYIIEKISSIIFKKEDLQFYVIRKIASFCCVDDELSAICFYILFWVKFAPRILFTFTFFIEVFFKQHLDLTFTFIPFLLIIYLEPIFLFIIKHFYDTYYEGVTSFLDFDFDSKPDDIVITFKPGVEEFGIPYDAQDVEEYFHNHFYVLYSIPFFLEDYQEWSEIYLIHHKTLILQTIRLLIYVFILIYGII